MLSSKIWTPPFAPSVTDISAYAGLFKNIDTTLLTNGWILDAESANYDLDYISGFPEWPTDRADNAWSGTRVYILNDQHRDKGDVFLQLKFGIGCTGSRYNALYRVPKIYVAVSASRNFDTTNANYTTYPGISDAGTPFPTVGPQFSTPGTAVMSMDPEIGFFALAYGIGSIQPESWANTGNTNPDTFNFPQKMPMLSIIIQRNTDSAGNVGPGFTTIVNRAATVNPSYSYQYYDANPLRHRFLSTGFSTVADTVTFTPPFAPTVQLIPSYNGMVQVFPLNTLTPEYRPLRNVCLYHKDQISEGTNFEIETENGTHTYYALGDHALLNATRYYRVALRIK